MKKKTLTRKNITPSSQRGKWIQSRFWLIAFGIGVVACIVAFILNIIFSRVHPGTWWGMGYGIAAAVLFLGVMMYGVRRRIMRFRPGRTFLYMQFHIYAGLLFLLLMFMHIGFKIPHGVLTWWLWFLSIFIVLSGLFGILIQKWIPTLLNSALSVEVNYARVPELIEDLKDKAEKLIEAADYQVRDFYRQSLAPAFAAGPQPNVMYFLDITGGIQKQTKSFDYLRKFLNAEEKYKLGELEKLYKAKLEMDAHYTLQRALRWWLYLHLPISILLIVLLGYHIFAVLYW